MGASRALTNCGRKVRKKIESLGLRMVIGTAVMGHLKRRCARA
jgi:hypothetical protein